MLVATSCLWKLDLKQHEEMSWRSIFIPEKRSPWRSEKGLWPEVYAFLTWRSSRLPTFGVCFCVWRQFADGTWILPTTFGAQMLYQNQYILRMTRWGFSFETGNRQIFSSHLSPGTILSKPSRPKPESSTCSETSPGPRLRLPDFFTHFLGGDLKSSDAACGTSPGDDGRSVVMPRRSWSRSESVGLGWNDGKSEASTGGRAPKNHAVFQLAKKELQRWQLKHFLFFATIWGNDLIWRAYFSDGWFNHQQEKVRIPMFF